MSKIAVVYWSGTGNTEAMAGAVAAGARAAGAEAELIAASDFNAGRVANYDAIAFGCPAMGSEQLEEYEFEPMFDECKSALRGKRIALFGSYGWGDGEWMRSWEAAAPRLRRRAGLRERHVLRGPGRGGRRELRGAGPGPRLTKPNPRGFFRGGSSFISPA